MIYLASPYSHPSRNIQEARFEGVERMTALLMDRGLFVYSPIVHCHVLALKYSMPTDAGYWKAYNFNTLRRCDALYILTLDGWQQSKGVEMELWFAKQCGLPCHTVDLEGNLLGYDY